MEACSYLIREKKEIISLKTVLLRYFRKLRIYGLNCRNEDGSVILVHYLTIYGTKFFQKIQGFFSQKSTLVQDTMKNWIILWFWNIVNPFKSKDFCVNLKEDVNFVKFQVFISWKKSCWIFKTYNSKNQHIF